MNLTYLGKFNSQTVNLVVISLVALCLLSKLVVAVDKELSLDPSGSLQAVSDSNKDKDTHYAVIIDCGSSGSRANLFQWDSSIKFPHFLEHIQPVLTSIGKPANKKVKPGASSLEGKAEATDKYLGGISDFVRETLPPSAESRTAVYVLATAGLRLVEEPRRSNIIAQITDHFVKLKYAKVRVQVISGEEEGMFLWLTVNSRLGAFSSRRKSKKTTGVIEMGGASVQVAYELNNDLEEKIRKVLGISEAQLEFPQLKVRPRITKEISVDLNGNQQIERKNYQLFSATFLGFGSNEARKNYVQFLVSSYLRKKEKSISNKFNELVKSGSSEDRFDNGKALTVPDPCFADGDHEEVKMPKSIFEEFKTKSVGYKLSEDKAENFNVIAEGSGSFRECFDSVTKMLVAMKQEQMDCEKGKACTLSLLGSDFVPFDEINFIGTGEFYYSTFSLLNADGFVDRNFMTERLKDVCESSLANLNLRFPNANDNDPTRLSQECFKATWVLVLLGEQGFGLAEDHYSMRTVGAIKGAPLEWTLGALVDKALAIEMAIQTRPDKEEKFKPRTNRRNLTGLRKQKEILEQRQAALAAAKQPEEDVLPKFEAVEETLKLEETPMPEPRIESPRRSLDVLGEIVPAEGV